ncbi:DUF503 domain-containing protein [Jeotgalibacillus campisalis]|uniref:YlxP-like protein n=1 Tax=Jeotgalibacillus campisalis TaxID=220754 RepID=A0A0C2S129_9BACL|nr:DUF503 domain-containing protein [Jeotgalibacillus campisalis]KIL47759.1 hypothetical protein KR50_19260 [Jeotgalibacillus campisalis]
MIAYAECEFKIDHSHSLKEKRAVLQRVLSRVKRQYNISIAEVDHQDVWQRTTIELVAVASSKDAAEREIHRALKLMESFPEWEAISIAIDFM